MEARRLWGLGLAALSGVLYGSINVLSKPLDVHPLLKGAMAYLVGALVLSPWLWGLRVARRDVPKVVAMGVLGGAVAPLLLFYGLVEATAVDAGLLLTLELVATAAFAMVFLGERFARRESWGLVFLFVAALAVAGASRGATLGASTMRGVLLVGAAAVAWGIDNTVSARLVGAYRPASLIAVKGLIGGALAVAAALWVEAPVPELRPALGMALLGVFAIAVSSLCFYFALRFVGAGRTSAMNVATTALVGALGGVLLLREALHVLHFGALAAVLTGSVLLARRRRVVAAPVGAEIGPG